MLPPTSPQLPSHPATSAETEEFRHTHLRGYSKSNLEPVLREQGTLKKPRGARKPGRPRILPTWFPAVAQAMADGTRLRDPLQLNGIALDERQIRALYRNRESRRLYQEARNHHQHSDLYFGKRLTREERFRRTL